MKLRAARSRPSSLQNKSVCQAPRVVNKPLLQAAHSGCPARKAQQLGLMMNKAPPTCAPLHGPPLVPGGRELLGAHARHKHVGDTWQAGTRDTRGHAGLTSAMRGWLAMGMSWRRTTVAADPDDGAPGGSVRLSCRHQCIVPAHHSAQSCAWLPPRPACSAPWQPPGKGHTRAGVSACSGTHMPCRHVCPLALRRRGSHLRLQTHAAAPVAAQPQIQCPTPPHLAEVGRHCLREVAVAAVQLQQVALCGPGCRWTNSKAYSRSEKCSTQVQQAALCGAGCSRSQSGSMHSWLSRAMSQIGLRNAILGSAAGGPITHCQPAGPPVTLRAQLSMCWHMPPLGWLKLASTCTCFSCSSSTCAARTGQQARGEKVRSRPGTPQGPCTRLLTNWKRPRSWPARLHSTAALPAAPPTPHPHPRTPSAPCNQAWAAECHMSAAQRMHPPQFASSTTTQCSSDPVFACDSSARGTHLLRPTICGMALLLGAAARASRSCCAACSNG